MNNVLNDSFIVDPGYRIPSRPRRLRVSTLLLSVLAHAGIVILVALYGVTATHPPAKVEPVQAKLVFAPTPAPAASVAPTSTIPEIEPQPAKQSTLKNVPALEQAPPSADAQRAKEDTRAAALSRREQTPNAAHMPASRRGVSISPRQALNQFFSGQQAEQQNDDAAQAARRYQSEKTSPVLSDTRKGQPDEFDLPPPPKKVNCSNGVSDTLVLLSRLTGGNMICSDRDGNLKQYIDARVKKTPQNRE